MPQKNFFSLDGWALTQQSLQKKKWQQSTYWGQGDDRHFPLNFSSCTHCYIADLAGKPQATSPMEEGRLTKILPQLLCLLYYILLSCLFSFFFIIFAYHPQFPLPRLPHSPLLRMGTVSYRNSTKSGILSWNIPSHSSHPIKAEKSMNREWDPNIKLMHQGLFLVLLPQVPKTDQARQLSPHSENLVHSHATSQLSVQSLSGPTSSSQLSLLASSSWYRCPLFM